MPNGIPLARYHEHGIHLQLGHVPTNIRPYKYHMHKRVRLSI
jgi:hypothetical protein